jgi:ATP synthase protein I
MERSMISEGRPQSSEERLEGATDDLDAWGQAPAKVLSPEEARVLRARYRSLSPWAVVVVQAVAGLVVAALTGLVVGSRSAVWSALYGAAVAVLPAALLARGITRGQGVEARAAALNFMLWELMKMAVAVAMLAASAWIVPGLSWPALLVAMIVCMKMNWLALLWQGRKTNRS